MKVELNGKLVDNKAVNAAMDKQLRKLLIQEFIDEQDFYSDQQFLDRYCDLHLVTFGEDFDMVNLVGNI
jgi:hypothetical protein